MAAPNVVCGQAAVRLVDVTKELVSRPSARAWLKLMGLHFILFLKISKSEKETDRDIE